MLVIDDSSPDGTGEIADRLARELAVASRCSTGRARRDSGRAYLAGFRRALARRRRARARDGLRLLARPGGRAAAHRGGRGRRRPRARLPLRRGRRHRRTGGSCAASSRAAARSTRGVLLVAGPRPDRRLQVLPAARARGDRPRRDRRRRATCSRSRRRTGRCARGSGSSRCRSRFVDRTAGRSKMSRAIVLEAVWKVPCASARGAWPGRL